MPFRGLIRVSARKYVLDGVEMPHGKGKFWGFLAHGKTLGVSAALCVAKGIIESSLTKPHAFHQRSLTIYYYYYYYY